MVHIGSWGLPDFGITEAMWGRDNPNVGTSQSNSTFSVPFTSGTSTTAPNPQEQYILPSNQSYTSSGQVLGTNTNTTGGSSVPSPAPTGDGGGQSSGPSFEDILNQQYEQMFNNLSEQEAGLLGQRSNQEQIAQNTYQQGANTLGNQYTQNKGDIEQGQTKALTDLSNAIRQQWQQGNTMLGTRGASDSSAAKQYSYALTKLGTQQRGDVMQESSKRLGSLKQTYDTNLQNLELEKNNQLLNIAGWFADAQNQVKGLRGQLQAQKSSEILNFAMQQLQNIQNQSAQQKSILDQWAANTAKSLPQLTQMLQQNAQNLPTFQGLFGNIQGMGGSGGGLFGYGNTSDEQKNIFGY